MVEMKVDVEKVDRSQEAQGLTLDMKVDRLHFT